MLIRHQPEKSELVVQSISFHQRKDIRRLEKQAKERTDAAE